jgi:hypothetical protein
MRFTKLLPDFCPDCGGRLDQTHFAQQFQVEILRKPIHRQFNVHVGRCRHCRRRVPSGRRTAQRVPADAGSLSHAQLNQGVLTVERRRLQQPPMHQRVQRLEQTHAATWHSPANCLGRGPVGGGFFMSMSDRSIQSKLGQAAAANRRARYNHE